ncbi:MAG TPA: glycosyltransferase family 2 protein [Myxococcota bacterium]|nr:glycosyltransferase family 2 protein [Myxococcota bacterium]
MIAVVMPCYRVRDHVLEVIARIGRECDAIYVVDDACPEGTGDHVEAHCRDPRVRVLRHAENQGVGGATLTGYRAALADGATVLVKLDGDGQMDPAQIPRLVAPIVAGKADYAKGNRFHDLDSLRRMPGVRLAGNSVLSFVTKLSTGYWNVIDPTNGFTALHSAVARELPFEKLSRRFFFESDLLFRLGILRAVVCDVRMPTIYSNEKSTLVVPRIVPVFLFGHAKNTLKRIFYSYYLRNFNIASIEIVVGLLFISFGSAVGVRHWWLSHDTGVPATSGTVMLAALPVIVGVQLVLAFLSYDLQNVPREPLSGQPPDPYELVVRKDAPEQTGEREREEAQGL